MAPHRPGTCRIHLIRILGTCLFRLIGLSPVNSLLDDYLLLPAVPLPSPPPLPLPQTYTAPSTTSQISTQHAATCCIGFHHFRILPYSAWCFYVFDLFVLVC